MNTGALIMFLFGATMLWGGLIVCLAIAIKNNQHQDENENMEQES